MERVEPEPRLSQMTTHWTAVVEAHNGTPGQVNSAISQLMCRYGGAVHRYFLKAVKDPAEAEDLDQDFAIRFLRGDFRRCDPKRGRFRDYVKRAVQNMISDHFRRKKTLRSKNLPMVEPAVLDPALSRFEEDFVASWRNDLLERSWAALAELEKNTGHPYHSVLRFRVDNPELSSEQAAEKVSRIIGQSLTAGAMRQAVMHSRRKFVEFLIADVLESMDRPTQDELEEELGELKLLEYCRPYMKRSSDTA